MRLIASTAEKKQQNKWISGPLDETLNDFVKGSNTQEKK